LEQASGIVWAIGMFGPLVICYVLLDVLSLSFRETLKYGFYLCGSLSLLILVAAWLLPSEISYKVDLEGIPGEPTIFITQDKSQAQRIADAINDAIARTGQQPAETAQPVNEQP
jgi:hypothetical protein